MSLRTFLFDERGKPRRTRVIAVVATGIGLAIGGAALAGMAATMSGHPNLQATWVLLTVVLLKLPIGLLAWWLIVQNKELPGNPVVWDEEETREILQYIRTQAQDALTQPDAASRLEYLRKEAWHVADRSSGAMKSDAVAVALEVDRLVARSGRRLV